MQDHIQINKTLRQWHKRKPGWNSGLHCIMPLPTKFETGGEWVIKFNSLFGARYLKSFKNERDKVVWDRLIDGQRYAVWQKISVSTKVFLFSRIYCKTRWVKNMLTIISILAICLVTIIDIWLIPLTIRYHCYCWFLSLALNQFVWISFQGNATILMA